MNNQRLRRILFSVAVGAVIAAPTVLHFVTDRPIDTPIFGLENPEVEIRPNDVRILNWAYAATSRLNDSATNLPERLSTFEKIWKANFERGSDGESPASVASFWFNMLWLTSAGNARGYKVDMSSAEVSEMLEWYVPYIHAVGRISDHPDPGVKSNVQMWMYSLTGHPAKFHDYDSFLKWFDPLVSDVRNVHCKGLPPQPQTVTK